MSSSIPEGEVLPSSHAAVRDTVIPGGPVHPPEYAPGEDARNVRVRRERSGWNPMVSPATYSLLGINIAVYLWMVAHGVSPTAPSTDALVQYGANDAVRVLFSGEWYRVFTAIFLHVGIIHLACNMWCLWNLGLLGEPLVGPFGLAAIYVLTGIAGNLLSLGVNVVWFRQESIGAGASGAVFGLAGILIVLLSNRKLPIPWPEMKKLRRSVIHFAALNFLVGFGTVLYPIVRIDNMAHLGGFTSGLVLGLPLMPKMTAGREGYLGRQKVVFPAAALLLLLFAYWIYKMSR